jgi:hypothetical protein
MDSEGESPNFPDISPALTRHPLPIGCRERRPWLSYQGVTDHLGATHCHLS